MSLKKTVIGHFDLSENGHLGKLCPQRPASGDYTLHPSLGHLYPHAGAFRPMHWRGTSRQAPPREGSCVEEQECDWPALPELAGSGRLWGLLKHAVSSPHLGPCSPELSKFPSFLGDHRGVRLGWGRTKVGLHLRIVLGTACGKCLPPTPTEMTGDLPSHTQPASGRAGHTRPHLSTLPVQALQRQEPTSEIAARRETTPSSFLPSLFPSSFYRRLAPSRCSTGGEAKYCRD